MGNIKISTKNIGGTEKASVQLVSGSVNIIEGTSFSGKSSLMRGVLLGLVGAPNEHRDEIERLHLNDTDPESHSPLLRRGSSEGLVVIEHDGGKIEARLPLSGRVSGKGSNEKAVYTSMLSDLPKTNLYSAVFDGDNGDDFEWVSTVVSEAKHYIVWQNVLRPIKQELVTVRAKFEQWKSSKGDGDARKEEIDERLEELDGEIDVLRKAQGAIDDKLRSNLKTAETQHRTHAADYNHLATEIQVLKAENESQLRRIAAANAQKKIAVRRLDEAEDLENTELIAPDVPKLEAAIQKAQEEYDSVRKDAPPSTVRIIDVWLEEKIAGPKLEEVIQSERAELGDKSKLAEAGEILKKVKANKDSEVRKFMETRSKIGSASQMAAAARSEIKSANQTIADANANMGVKAADLPKMEEDFASSERQYKLSEKEVKTLRAQVAGGDSPELKKLTSESKALQDEKDSLESSTTFELRLTSLQMMPNEGILLTEDLGEHILGNGSGGKANKGLVNSNLMDIGSPEVRSLIKAEIDNGILVNIGPTTDWVSETVENQQQQTRRIFNEVGTTLFEKMPNSRIKSVELDTDYRLRQTWDNGETTGLAGSGGERALTAAAILIAMRKAFTPDIPILMIDGVLEKLDVSKRKILLDFLKDYAETDGVTIVVSLLNEKETEVKVSTL
jgi:ABC-type dipeptide/oligopeptide/nickel transport system ATPase subunit